MFHIGFQEKSYRELSPEQAKERLKADNSILLLDVRTPEEYQKVHIPGSVSLPLNELADGIFHFAPEQNKEIIVYCLSGARAGSACKILSQIGYSNVSTMGGIRSWKYELEQGPVK